MSHSLLRRRTNALTLACSLSAALTFGACSADDPIAPPQEFRANEHPEYLESEDPGDNGGTGTSIEQEAARRQRISIESGAYVIDGAPVDAERAEAGQLARADRIESDATLLIVTMERTTFASFESGDPYARNKEQFCNDQRSLFNGAASDYKSAYSEYIQMFDGPVGLALDTWSGKADQLLGQMEQAATTMKATSDNIKNAGC